MKLSPDEKDMDLFHEELKNGKKIFLRDRYGNHSVLFKVNGVQYIAGIVFEDGDIVIRTIYNNERRGWFSDALLAWNTTYSGGHYKKYYVSERTKMLLKPMVL